MFASVHPGSEPRAQLLVKTKKLKKMINIKKEQNEIRRCLVGVSAGAQPTMPVRPGTTVENSDAGTAVWPGSTVAGMWCVGLGYKNCNRRLQAPICVHSSPFQYCSRRPVARKLRFYRRKSPL